MTFESADAPANLYIYIYDVHIAHLSSTSCIAHARDVFAHFERSSSSSTVHIFVDDIPRGIQIEKTYTYIDHTNRIIFMFGTLLISALEYIFSRGVKMVG